MIYLHPTYLIDFYETAYSNFRIYRAISYFLGYLIFELPRGLDISPRSKSTGITLQGNHGYALTSRAALKNMLIGIELQNQSFLDIGIGKGGGNYLFP